MTFDAKFFEGLTCPASVTWTHDIQGIFTATDVACMKEVTKGALDLSDYASVKLWAHKIFLEVQAHNMPKPDSGEPPWTDDRVNLFGCWIQKGCPQ